MVKQFLDTTKQDYIDGVMKIKKTSYERKSKLNGKKVSIPQYYMIWEDGTTLQISKSNLNVFIAEVKQDRSKIAS